MLKLINMEIKEEWEGRNLDNTINWPLQVPVHIGCSILEQIVTDQFCYAFDDSYL